MKCPKAKQHQATASAGELRVVAKTQTSMLQVIFSKFQTPKWVYGSYERKKMTPKKSSLYGLKHEEQTGTEESTNSRRYISFFMYFGLFKILKRERKRRDK